MHTCSISQIITFSTNNNNRSVDLPLKYYHNNVAGTVTLLQALEAHGCTSVVFSSSCTVYGDPDTVPVRTHESECSL
jgi:UDP-glucose 4-epimerase